MRHRTGWWAAASLVGGGLLLATGLVFQAATVRPVSQHEPKPTAVASAPAATLSATPSAAAVLQKPGDIPASGPATFAIGATMGGILGSAGTVKRFRIAAESNVSGELDEFTQAVDQALGDPRSWIAGKQVRFQRVGEGQAFDFTVYLVTRQTAYEMCRVNGVDIRENGVPYTSCRQVRKVIINIDRWRLSVPEYVAGGIPLRQYREYVINHEVGHELGRGHEGCPAAGQPAPVMLTQTLSLQGCTANAWPYLDGKRYAGPPAR